VFANSHSSQLFTPIRFQLNVPPNVTFNYHRGTHTALHNENTPVWRPWCWQAELLRTYMLSTLALHHSKSLVSCSLPMTDCVFWSVPIPNESESINRTALFQFRAVGSGWVHLVRRPLFGLLYQPRMWMMSVEQSVEWLARGTGNTRGKHFPVALCPPQTPHDLTWLRTGAAAVGSQRLTAWATAWPMNRTENWWVSSDGDSALSDGRWLHRTTQSTADTHPNLEWDSNLQHCCSSGRRQPTP
jgi:hypothetical protein